MEQLSTLHIVAASSRTRAELARIGFALGHHAEVYSDPSELLHRPPEDGIIIATDEPGEGVGRIMRSLARRGLWLPVVALSEHPRPRLIVAAMKEGALDYISLPLKVERLSAALARIARDAIAYSRARRRMIAARSRIASLSKREREVLDWLAEGRSNKMIARELGISPRTVEIHRANMMAKLGASHSAAAIRLRVEAQLDTLKHLGTGVPEPASVLPVAGHEPVAEVMPMPQQIA